MNKPIIPIPEEAPYYDEFHEGLKNNNQFDFYCWIEPITFKKVKSVYLNDSRVKHLLGVVNSIIEDKIRMEELEKKEQDLKVLMEAEKIRKSYES